MEKDNEISGQGNNLDFGARIYDSRLGRWLSVDPLTHNSPSITPYSFANGSPIAFIDPDGEWVKIATTNYYTDRKGNLKVKHWYNIFKKTIYRKIDVSMGSVKLYNHNAKKRTREKVDGGYVQKYVDITQQELCELGAKMKARILAEYGCRNETDPTDPDVTVDVSLTFDGDIEVINDFEEVTADDEVIILFQSVEKNYEWGDDNPYRTGSKNIEAAAFTYKGSSFMMIEYSHLAEGFVDTYVHEWTHQRSSHSVFYNDHKDGGIMSIEYMSDDDRAVNFENLWNLGTENLPSEGSKRLYSRILSESKAEKEKQKTNE